MAQIKGEQYELWIDAYSPETIPLKRLGEYMEQLGRLLGHWESVHFHRLEGGSTAVQVEVQREAVPKIEQRIDSIKRAEAPGDVVDAQNLLNEMLRDDNAIGEFRRLKRGNRPQLRLITFAGREIPKPQKVGPFNEPATFKGELVRIEGEDETKHAGIKDAQGRLWSGDMNRQMAVEMREYLFEWVMVEGIARWLRNENGEWELAAFHIRGCKLLPKDTLADDIEALRKIPGNKWLQLKDPLGVIRESRKDDDEIH